MRAALVLCSLAALTARARAGSDLPRHAGMYVKATSPLAMVSSDVSVSIHGAIVEVSVAQTFRNDTDRTTEATYIFPLPADAAVSAMAMTLGSRTIHAAIASRADAHKRYEDAVSAGVGAGLLEQERPDVFTQTVSAIPAHGTVAVTLRYDTIAGFADGRWSLALPLVVAPRYVPGTASGRATTGAGARPDTDRAPDASRVTPASSPEGGGPTHVAIEFADAVDDVASPSHELTGRDKSFAVADPHSDHDVVLRWRARDAARGWDEPGAGSGDAGFAAVIVEAPAAKPRAAGSRIDVTLVLDRSAASLGDADAVGHPLVRALAGTLAAHDTLAVTGSDQIARQAPRDALAELERAWSRAAGAFDLTAVLKALHDRGHTGAVVLVTGGLVADDVAAVAAATALGVPVHVVGVGAAPNRALLDEIATATGGTVRVAAPDDDVAALARDVVGDAAAPPQQLTVNWGSLAATEVVPALLPRLGAGQARLVVAKIGQPRRANARAAGDVFAIEQLTAEPAVAGETSPLGPLARRWARDRIDELLAARHPDAKAIETFALRYGLVSPYTAMVAVGSDVVERGGVKHSVSVPVSVPAGMRWQAVDHQDRVEVKEERERNEEAPREQTKTLEEAEKTGKTSNDKNRDDRSAHDGRGPSANVTGPARPANPTPRPTTPAHTPAPTTAPPSTTRQPTVDVGGEVDDDSAADGAPADDGVSARKRKLSNKSRDDGDSAGVASATEADAKAMPAPEAAGRDYAYDTTESVADLAVSQLHVRPFGVGLGGGIVAAHGSVDALGSVTLGYAKPISLRNAIEVEGALWLAGSNVEGQLVAGLIHALSRIELGAGVGLHLGNGVGPVVDVALRVPLWSHLGLVLRYDGALLFDSGKSELDHAATLGIEWRW